MIKKSDLLTGLGAIYKTPDISRLERVRPFYKRHLTKSEAPQPGFLKQVNANKLAKLGNKPPKTIRTPEEAVVRLQHMGTNLGHYSRDDMLDAIRQVTCLFPGDLGLALTCSKMLMHKDLFADASVMLHRCTQMDEKCDYAWAHLALIAALAQDHGRALQCATMAMRLGNDLFRTMQKIYVYGQLVQGLPAHAGPIDGTPHFQIRRGELDVDMTELPAVSYHVAPTDLPDQPIVLFACDDGYFERFGKALLLSLLAVKDAFTLHVHLVAPSPGSLAWLEAFSETHGVNIIVSRDETPPPQLTTDKTFHKTYLASCRFLHIPGFMEKFRKAYIIVDADSLLNNPDGLRSFPGLTEKPVLFYSEQGPIWDSISAGLVSLPQTTISKRFAKHCQAFLLHSLFGPEAKPYWYVDQMALFGAYLEQQPDIKLCPAHLLADSRCGEEALFWTLSNDKEDPAFTKRLEEFLADGGPEG